MADHGFREGAALAQRLERGEIIVYATCPFSLPTGDDRLFLFDQELGGRSHKNISYQPNTGRIAGFRRRSADQIARLRRLMAGFSETATTWLAKTLPEYAGGWQIDQASFRPEEEATRQLRLSARNDLLHVDAFPSRPTHGRRLLRLFVNINLDEPRIWVTSETFPALLDRYGHEFGLSGRQAGWLGRLGHRLIGRAPRSTYDTFMLGFHNFLKRNHHFQERGPKKYWTFPPGSAWLVMTDMVSHGALRGRYALEHSYFIDSSVLAFPEQSPAALLNRACAVAASRRAA
jgi:hypothetical protein